MRECPKNHVEMEIIKLTNNMYEVDCLSRILSTIMLDEIDNIDITDIQTANLILSKAINSTYKKFIALKYYCEQKHNQK